MELTKTQFYLYMFIAQLIIGIIFGLVPFFLGRKRGKLNLSNWGLLVTIVAGAISPLGAMISLIVFVWMIVKKPSQSAESTTAE